MEKIIENPAGSPIATAPHSDAAIAEKLLGTIDWVEPNAMGYCECPGKKNHSTNDGIKDCAIYLDRIPTVHCLHASCGTAIAETNRKLRAAILNPDGDESFQLPKISEQDRARMRERELNERIRLRAQLSLPRLLEGHAWPYDEIMRDSPVAVKDNEPDHWKLLLGKFQPEDVVWIGDKFDSGKPEHARHFRRADEWLKEKKVPGPLICPVAFKNNSHQRSNDHVLARRFFVVESDTLKRDEVGAVFKWLQAECRLKLIAIVDTGGKSLHGWFDFAPCERDLDHLKLVLPAMQCDPKLFTASQPVRLPGVPRDGKPGKRQRLVWLAKTEVAHV